jgi:alpha-galactosidase
MSTSFDSLPRAFTFVKRWIELQRSSLKFLVFALAIFGVLAASAGNLLADDDILTPKPLDTPRINGAKVFGVRPGHPVLFTVAATGDRPIQFSAEGLPEGVKLDPNTGFLSGKSDKPGEYKITLHAKNSKGHADSKFKLVVGDTIALTPQLGWNSWNCFGASVTGKNIEEAADAMANTGLVNHGWSYINIDDYWEYNERLARQNDPTMDGVTPRAEDGTINTNKRFPNMKGLVDHIHSLGLKAGIYSGPGPTTCGGCTASYEHEEQDAKSYANWGFDYLKYDLCSYTRVHRITDRESAMKPYQVMQAALQKVDRDILYSLCQYGGNQVWEWGPEVGGNSWRTTGDITDRWDSLTSIWDRQVNLAPYAGPGHWNDADMMIVGVVSVGSGRNLHPTNLTHDEQYSHVSLWSLLAAPMLIGCDMTKFDDFTLNLLTNDEVLAVNQDPLGKQATRVVDDPTAGIEIWARPLADGTMAVGLFNRGRYQLMAPRGRGPQAANQPWRVLDRSTRESTEFPTQAEANEAFEKVATKSGEVAVHWADLKLEGNQKVRDLWRQKDLGAADGHYTANVPMHGVVLLKIGTPKTEN